MAENSDGKINNIVCLEILFHSFVWHLFLKIQLDILDITIKLYLIRTGYN